MKILTIEEEAANLSARFEGINRAEFARKHALKGGQSMIYQNITGRRPISMEAAKAYASGFGCSLEEISPRLAREATDAASHLSRASNGNDDEGPDTKVNARSSAPSSEDVPQYAWINSREAELITLYRTTDDRGRNEIMREARSTARVIAPLTSVDKT